MDSDIETLANEMLVKSRVYIKAINARDEMLAQACRTNSEEDQVRYEAAKEAADDAHEDFEATLTRLHQARKS